MDKEMPDHQAIGVAGHDFMNFPLMLVWKIGPPSPWATPLASGIHLASALFFGEACRERGGPDGVVNLITGDGEFFGHP